MDLIFKKEEKKQEKLASLPGGFRKISLELDFWVFDQGDWNISLDKQEFIDLREPSQDTRFNTLARTLGVIENTLLCLLLSLGKTMANTQGSRNA